MRPTSSLLALAVLATPLLASAALAGPAEDMARARIEAIAAGDVAAVTAGSPEGATLNWVGGPLDGLYATPEAQTEVWTKFTTAQGPQEATIGDVTEAANPAGATVVADVTFAGKNMVKVLYVLTYRGDALVSEIWQVNPPAP